jgi:hypothetical protein
MCTELLPPGGYPIAVTYIISVYQYQHTTPNIITEFIPTSYLSLYGSSYNAQQSINQNTFYHVQKQQGMDTPRG